MLRTIAKQFRRPSGFLGKLASKFMQKGNLKAYEKLFKFLTIQDNQKIFEIGYGHGLGIENILSKHNCFVSGIDFSKLMYKQASKRNQQYIAQNKAKLHFGDFLEFEMEEKLYDKVFCINVVYFWNDLLLPFTKIRKSLKKDGTFCFYMAHKDELGKIKFATDGIFNKRTIEEVTDKLKEAGFSSIEHEYYKGYFVTCK